MDNNNNNSGVNTVLIVLVLLVIVGLAVRFITGGFQAPADQNGLNVNVEVPENMGDGGGE